MLHVSGFFQNSVTKSPLPPLEKGDLPLSDLQYQSQIDYVHDS